MLAWERVHRSSSLASFDRQVESIARQEVNQIWAQVLRWDSPQAGFIIAKRSEIFGKQDFYDQVDKPEQGYGSHYEGSARVCVRSLARRQEGRGWRQQFRARSPQTTAAWLGARIAYAWGSNALSALRNCDV